MTGRLLPFIAAVAVTAVAIAAAATTAFATNKIKVTFDLAWGVKGSAPGQFNELYDIAVGPKGHVFVTDTRNRRVQVFTADGKFLREFGLGVLEKPAGIAIGKNGDVFVTDYDLDRVFKFSNNGKLLRKFGRHGSGEGEFDSPSDVALDDEGNIYIADLYNHRVQKFDGDGMFLRAWGEWSQAEDKDKKKKKSTKIFGIELPTTKMGPKEGTFNYPAKLAVTGDSVYVADTYNNRVQVFSTTGEFLTVLPGSFKLSSAIARGAASTGGAAIFVADYFSNRVRIYPGGAAASTASTSFGKKGIGTGEFRGPTGIAASPDGYLYVTDWLNHRVQRFRVGIDF